MGSLLLTLIYVCFISLGLPDSLLGSAWPVLHGQINVPVSFAGVISMVIFMGTILSSLYSDRLLHKFGTGKVTAVSTALTAAALFGFSVSNQFWMLILWAIPYGFGAGAVDAILNNYVAVHYQPQHMSWLHCMWGVGASVSPYIMSFSLVRLENWNSGYLIVAVIQTLLAAFLFTTLPVWKREERPTANGTDGEGAAKALTFREIFATKGALPCFLTSFAYCSLELTASLWASSYLVQKWAFAPETAAGYASMFYIGITLGRFLNGFLAMKINDHTLIRAGFAMIFAGILLVMGSPVASGVLTGFVVIGLGCAPIYPCMIHVIPDIFGADKSQAIIGVQMAFAYTGFLVMPPLFGLIAEYATILLLPAYLLALLVTMAVTHGIVFRMTRA